MMMMIIVRVDVDSDPLASGDVDDDNSNDTVSRKIMHSLRIFSLASSSHVTSQTNNAYVVWTRRQRSTSRRDSTTNIQVSH